MCSVRSDDGIKILFARRKMDGSARIFARSIRAGIWVEFRDQLISKFGRQITRLEVYRQLENRRRRADESAHRYILEMQEIASQSNIDEFELVRFIINGLNDRSPAAATICSATTMRQLEENLPNYEYYRRQYALRNPIAGRVNQQLPNPTEARGNTQMPLKPAENDGRDLI